jgi:sphinganine C4-monooxygenase
MDSVGAAIPGLILKMHPYTSALFFCIATLKTVDDHCGYTFRFDPLQAIFPNNARYHDFHHYGKGTMYNFSQVI